MKPYVLISLPWRMPTLIGPFEDEARAAKFGASWQQEHGDFWQVLSLTPADLAKPLVVHPPPGARCDGPDETLTDHEEAVRAFHAAEDAALRSILPKRTEEQELAARAVMEAWLEERSR